MPESPRFLLCQKRFTEAKQAFNFIARWNGLPDTTADRFVFLKSSAERDISDRNTDDKPSLDSQSKESKKAVKLSNAC